MQSPSDDSMLHGKESTIMLTMSKISSILRLSPYQNESQTPTSVRDTPNWRKSQTSQPIYRYASPIVFTSLFNPPLRHHFDLKIPGSPRLSPWPHKSCHSQNDLYFWSCTPFWRAVHCLPESPTSRSSISTCTTTNSHKSAEVADGSFIL